MNSIRGKEISLIFQDPLTSLNPVMKVGDQISEAIGLHFDMSKQETQEKAKKMLDLVGIPSSEERYYDYPFTFSGGMRQRLVIASALSSYRISRSIFSPLMYSFRSCVLK